MHWDFLRRHQELDTAVNIRNSKKKINRVCQLVFLFLLSGLISGCTLITRDYQRPPVDIAHTGHVEYPAAENLANTAWWQQFKDPALNSLIQTALNENKDLRIAAARVEEFTGRLETTQSGFYPQLNYGGSATRAQQSKDRPLPFLARSTGRTNSTFQTLLNVSWELDLWGRIKRSSEAARADLLSAEEGRQAVILTLVSAVASTYFEILTLDKQLQISRQTLASRKEWLHLFEDKFKGGQISNEELAQIKSAYEQSAAYIPNLEWLIAIHENSLSVLLGRGPGIIKRDKTLDTLTMPVIPRGIPSDLLEQRPDIRQKEQNLIAANARIGVARTLYFPSISLTGLLGYSSSSLSDFLDSSANFWQWSGETLGPIFSGWRIEGEVRQAEAKEKQLLNDYLKTIQTAFREIDDSLITIQKLQELKDIQKRQIIALKQYVYFSRNRYETGFSRYLEVLDAERNLYAAEIAYAQTQNDLFSALVGTYKAMGGGWVMEASQLIESPSHTTE